MYVICTYCTMHSLFLFLSKQFLYSNTDKLIVFCSSYPSLWLVIESFYSSVNTVENVYKIIKLLSRYFTNEVSFITQHQQHILPAISVMNFFCYFSLGNILCWENILVNLSLNSNKLRI